MLCIRLGWNSNSASASLVFAMHEKETDVSLTKSNVSISTCSVKMLPVDQRCFIFYGSYCALSDGGMGEAISRSTGMKRDWFVFHL